jgi:hypothetical protein
MWLTPTGESAVSTAFRIAFPTSTVASPGTDAIAPSPIRTTVSGTAGGKLPIGTTTLSPCVAVEIGLRVPDRFRPRRS